MPPQDQNNPLSPNRPEGGAGASMPPNRPADVSPPPSMARPATQFRPENYSSSAEPSARPSVPPTGVGSPSDSTIAPEPTDTTPAAGSTPSGTSPSSNHMPGLGSTTTAPDLVAHKRKSAIVGIAILAVILVILLAVILMMGS